MNGVVSNAPDPESIRLARAWLTGAGDEPAAKTSFKDVERFDLLVRDDLFAALDGDRDRYAKAMAICDAALAENPDHAGALSFHGWGLMIKGGWAIEAGDADGGSALWNAGVQEINRAVSLAPSDVGPMLVRGSIFINASNAETLPGHLRGTMLALGTYDYERVYELQTTQGYFKFLSEHARGELLMGLADAWHRRGNMDRANDYFRLVADEVPDTAYSRDATAVLEGVKDLTTLESRSCIGCHTAR